MIITGRLGQLLVGIAVRQALSRTAQVQASLSRPGGASCPAAPVRPLPTWLDALMPIAIG